MTADVKEQNPGNWSVFDAVCVVLGVVIGSGIFALPSFVAANAPNSYAAMGLWLAGGFISLIGALCYAELATAYPNTGGDYYFLRRAYGSHLGFLFIWARMTVIQTGALAAAAFIGGNYATELLRLGAHSSSIYAALIIVALTLVNLSGLRAAKWTQNVLTATIVAGLLTVVASGLWLGIHADAAASAQAAQSQPGGPDVFGMTGLALIFVLFSYGGWNEAAYLSAEIRNPAKNITRTLIAGIGIITTIYLLVNAAMLFGLGRAGMAASNAVAADLLRQSWGEPGAIFISILVVVAVLSTVNATIITGGRSNQAMGRDFPRTFGYLGKWSGPNRVPAAALITQAVISLVLVLLSPVIFAEGGVEAMVAYTAPVFWFFFCLAGLSVIVLRHKDPARARPFRVPIYPASPILFCAVCVYMLYSSIAYAGLGSLVGVAVVVAGVPFLLTAPKSLPANP